LSSISGCDPRTSAEFSIWGSKVRGRKSTLARKKTNLGPVLKRRAEGRRGRTKETFSRLGGNGADLAKVKKRPLNGKIEGLLTLTFPADPKKEGSAVGTILASLTVQHTKERFRWMEKGAKRTRTKNTDLGSCFLNLFEGRLSVTLETVPPNRPKLEKRKRFKNVRVKHRSQV